jgi:hypothetical protein
MEAIEDGRIRCFNMQKGPADRDHDLNFWARELEDVVREIMEYPQAVFNGNQHYKFEMDLDETGKRLFGSEANDSVAFHIGHLTVHTCIMMVHTSTLCTTLHYYVFCRVGDRTVLLAIVEYIDGRFVQLKIPVKPIYATVRNLNSAVSGKACAWRVLGMMPSLKKSAPLDPTDTWWNDCRLRLHHACITHVVNMVNRFGSEDKHLLFAPQCADGQVYTSTY